MLERFLPIAAGVLFFLLSGGFQEKPADPPKTGGGPANIAPATPVSYTPSIEQTLRLKLHFKDLQLAQKDMELAQARVGAMAQVFQEQIADVKRENHWPDRITVDYQQLMRTGDITFADPAPEPPKKPAAEPKKP
jgi:hypothetical protein